MVSGHHRQRSTRETDGEVTQPEYVRLAPGQRHSSFRWVARRQAMLETSSCTVSKWHIQKMDGELMESMDQVARVGSRMHAIYVVVVVAELHRGGLKVAQRFTVWVHRDVVGSICELWHP